ncbi:GIY-YIG nuclease family protein [Mycobacterium angelicum]|uniref:GIY-YIG domain-containing protein n=1 Tax=Mycobacterium angelicum TaxID=470074 RepID=A0A1W9ZUN1_MYCAN|nr:GIY-YIG nuclease family protein [Mycobacterium angelicum]MCV7198652.1 GIY-YIG nuclease family protein [Mycobacterium angelicum]ORA21509.1 hypothetical protein BST12_11855 [Mycobacterium angelicum]
MTGKQVKLFLVDGAAGGLTTAEISNWTGKIVSAPRSKLAELVARPEAAKTGVYLLIGDDPEVVGGIRLYVGETDVLSKRLRDHHAKKDFWDRALLIASTDDNLTKAHARYLESELIRIGLAAGRSTLENTTSPDRPALPEADKAVMEEFIRELHILLPVLGIHLFRSRSAIASVSPAVVSESSSPIFRLAVPKFGIDARAQLVDGEFTVLAGSTVAAEIRANEKYAASTASAYSAYEAIHRKLREDGTIDITRSPAVTTRDVQFTSPSTAGSIVTGRSCNGRQAWTSDAGITYGAWETRGVQQ